MYHKPPFVSDDISDHRRNNRRDRGRLVPQLLGWGPTMYWSTNFLAVVFKKQEISQQVVTRKQDLASEFSQIFQGGHTPGPSQREGATPSRTQNPARPLAGRGERCWCWDPNLGPPQLFSRGWAPASDEVVHAVTFPD